jgi:hypothetical protein
MLRGLTYVTPKSGLKVQGGSASLEMMDCASRDGNAYPAAGSDKHGYRKQSDVRFTPESGQSAIH